MQSFWAYDEENKENIDPNRSHQQENKFSKTKRNVKPKPLSERNMNQFNRTDTILQQKEPKKRALVSFFR